MSPTFGPSDQDRARQAADAGQELLKAVFVKNEPISFEEIREIAAETLENPASHRIRDEFRLTANPENVLRMLDRVEDLEVEIERLKNKKCPHDLARDFLEGET